MKNGVYVEIGADSPRVINNTWLLESMYDWMGVSFEIDSIKVEYFNTIRRNKCICKMLLLLTINISLKKETIPNK